ncbi:hypothetical protein [Rhodohalobacter sulfatireducens]|uniref:Uncharacterized protein n=1 Tax=Rhodohalobacter sulfatireducens TaxID=2911366 RepID=A0ABS9KIT4_9BACT|nr:hypothetical protein [Rhodohalobacter sulfatireducens]MCG2590758.1 hypothetical protein [Rhodohalobacter sulfatireducens]
MKPTKRDWKIFRDMLPELRERYLAERNQTFITLLKSDERTPTEQFWDTLEAMKKEAKILQDCLNGYTKSNMDMRILLMLRHGLMKEEDLDGFSEELREWVRKVRQ